ncbi:unnamed protein product, partial [Ectocarpus sp. 12 AP-2014]
VICPTPTPPRPSLSPCSSDSRPSVLHGCKKKWYEEERLPREGAPIETPPKGGGIANHRTPHLASAIEDGKRAQTVQGFNVLCRNDAKTWQGLFFTSSDRPQTQP